MNFIRFSRVLIFSLLLAACNGSALKTGWKLRNVDLATLDPAQVRLAVHAPSWMQSMLDDLQLSVRFQSTDRTPAAGLFRLRRIDRSDDFAEIQRAGLAAENLSIFEITPEDLKAARKFQSELVALRSAEPGGYVNARIQRKGRAVCLSFPPAGEPTNVDVYLHPTDEVGWVLFSENEDIREFELAHSAPSPEAAPCRRSGKNDAGADDPAVDPATAGESAKKLQGGVRFQSGK